MVWARIKASSPSAQWSTAKPLCLRPFTMNEAIFWSSSTTRMRMDWNIEEELASGKELLGRSRTAVVIFGHLPRGQGRKLRRKKTLPHRILFGAGGLATVKGKSARFAFVDHNVMAATGAPHAQQCAFGIGLFRQMHGFLCGFDRLTIDFLDDIARFKARFSRSGVRLDLRDNHALYARRQIKLLPRRAVQVTHGHAVQRSVVILVVPVVVFGQVFSSRNFPHLHFEGFGCAIPEDFDGHTLARADPRDLEFEMTAVRYFLAIELDDNIAVSQASLFGGTLGRDITHKGAGRILELELRCQIRSNVLNHNPEIAAGYMTIFDQALHHVAGEVNGDGKANSLVPTAATEDGGINADQPAFSIDERATRVTGIDRGVRLDEVLVVKTDSPGSTGRAHDSRRDRLADAKRVPHRK